VGASYITVGSNTYLRQIKLTLSNGSIIPWPINANTNFAGATNVSLTLAGKLVGFEIDSGTSIFYVK
jgi:hypothetical protein